MSRGKRTLGLYFSRRNCSTLKSVPPIFEDKHAIDRVELGWDREWSSKRAQQHGTPVPTTYRMVLPPPNITGDLHLGHALTVAIEDSICRFQRLRGSPVVWIPGTDHAGIATQTVLERMLANQQAGSVRFSEEQRFEAARRWREQKESIINSQLRRLGASVNWDRALFTMDERMSAATVEAFVRLYETGKIYRDKRLVNWCTTLRSTISDIEVDHIDVKPDQKIQGVNVGCMHHFAYPIVGGGEVVVATGRLDTMLADVAVAVHPDDQRYSTLTHLQTILEHPISRRKLLLLKDSQIDPAVGTGAMKVTPAYSRVDFDLCTKHGIREFLECFDDAGLLTVEGFEGDTQVEATNKLLNRLDQLGLYRGTFPAARTVPICSRTGSIVDQRLKAQWFLKCGEVGQRTLKEIESGRLKFIPPYHGKILREWISKTQDWCISRQLWWGHRIPAYLSADGKWLVTKDPSTVPEGSVQDPDVLDTWFSSALYPLVAFGWPEVPKPPPLNLMETGHDILYFWVFRMILMSLELCNQLPFDTVMLHGLLRDANGRKMSKSLGNAIDPMHIINGASLETLQKTSDDLHALGYLNQKEAQAARRLTKKLFPQGIAQCGADALRFTLLKADTTAQDIAFDVRKTLASKKFCNKIWQGIRFYVNATQSHGYVTAKLNPQDHSLDEVDRWVLSKLSSTEAIVRESLESYSDIHHGSHSLEKFWLTNFCDVYLEFIKPDIWGATKDLHRRLAVATEIVTSFVIIASPFLPHLCEEVHHKLQLQRGVDRELCTSVQDCEWPSTHHWNNIEVEEKLDSLLEKVSEVRRVKQQSSVEALKMLADFNAFDRRVVRILCKIDSSRTEAGKSPL